MKTLANNLTTFTQVRVRISVPPFCSYSQDYKRGRGGGRDCPLPLPCVVYTLEVIRMSVIWTMENHLSEKGKEREGGGNRSSLIPPTLPNP